MEKITSGLPPLSLLYPPLTPQFHSNPNFFTHTYTYKLCLYISISISIYIYIHIYTQSICFILLLSVIISLLSLSSLYLTHLISREGFDFFFFTAIGVHQDYFTLTCGSTKLPCGLLSADI